METLNVLLEMNMSLIASFIGSGINGNSSSNTEVSADVLNRFFYRKWN